MNKHDILSTLTPQIVDKFRTAIEIGRWENGEKLTDAQRQTCMQAVMVWEHEYLPIAERTGYIQRPIKNNEIVGEECDIEHDKHYPNRLDQETPIKFS